MINVAVCSYWNVLVFDIVKVEVEILAPPLLVFLREVSDRPLFNVEYVLRRFVFELRPFRTLTRRPGAYPFTLPKHVENVFIPGNLPKLTRVHPSPAIWIVVCEEGNSIEDILWIHDAIYIHKDEKIHILFQGIVDLGVSLLG